MIRFRRHLSRAVLHALRHEPWAYGLEPDSDRIRAMYGHSIPGRIARTPAEPRAVLFHGTSPESAAAILVAGLRPMAHQYVHLSVDREIARSVGSRKAGEPRPLVVAARDAAQAGVVFYPGNDKVWLADEGPAKFISAR